MNQKVLYLVHAAVIAALYVVLTQLAASLGLASAAIQVRFSEALTILPVFTPAAIPGLFAGCVLANLLTGSVPLDVLFGSAATLLGALGTWAISHPPGQCASARYVRERPYQGTPVSAHCPWELRPWQKWLSPLPPIAANTLIVPFILAYVYQFEGSIPYFMLTVGLGEVISCGVLGLLLLKVLERYRRYIFS